MMRERERERINGWVDQWIVRVMFEICLLIKAISWFVQNNLIDMYIGTEGVNIVNHICHIPS